MGNAIARFMYGRNGMDQLNMTLLVIGLLLNLALMPIQEQSAMLGTIFYWISMALWVWVVFRCFSKNLTKRRGENAKLTGRFRKIQGRWQGAKARRADKDHKYFTCKSCKTICRVPLGKGNIVITCPKCGANIHAKT
ncbi:MAG: hypothetical protein RRY97_04085 [Oscillibacter sp.]